MVYTLNSAHEVYVGESLHAGARMRQHLRAWGEDGFVEGRLIVDPTFNKSVCLDLESYLIRLLAGEGRYTVLNSNRRIVDADYDDRESYRRRFAEIVDLLRREDLFAGSVEQIEASELFTLSPFKALNPEQVATVTGILESLASGLTSDRSTIVLQGEPGHEAGRAHRAGAHTVSMNANNTAHRPTITQEQFARAGAALDRGHDVIIDDTNLTTRTVPAGRPWPPSTRPRWCWCRSWWTWKPAWPGAEQRAAADPSRGVPREAIEAMAARFPATVPPAEGRGTGEAVAS